MKSMPALALALALLGTTARAEGPRCDNAQLMRVLGQHVGGARLAVQRLEQGQRVVVEDRASKELVLEVSCDEVVVPLADLVERPTKGPAKTRTLGAVTVSRTARGAVSVDIAAGALHREPMQLLVLDDQSVSLTRGEAVLYSFATRADGGTVEVEGRGVGCGCERTTAPDGKVSTRPL